MKVFKSKTIESFAKQVLPQSQALVIKGKGCCNDGDRPPPEKPPKETTQSSATSVLGG